MGVLTFSSGLDDIVLVEGTGTAKGLVETAVLIVSGEFNRQWIEILVEFQVGKVVPLAKM